MTQINTAPLSGFRDTLPYEKKKLEECFALIRHWYTLYGFQEIETPTIERNDVLFAKTTGEIRTQIFALAKPDQSLRFDLTVPLARFIIEHQNDFVFPAQVFQIGRVYRGERAQAGRRREFYQCDIDILAPKLSIQDDFKVIIRGTKTLAAVAQVLGFSAPICNISHRKIMDGIFEFFKVDSEKKIELLAVIDKADKFETPDDFLAAFKAVAHAAPAALTTIIMRLIQMRCLFTSPEMLTMLASFEVTCATFDVAVSEIKNLQTFLNFLPEEQRRMYQFNGSIIRGQAYYTGLSFEAHVPEVKGTVFGGGRYSHLTSDINPKVNLEGVGGAIGITRLMDAWIETHRGEKLIDETILIYPFDHESMGRAAQVQDKIREQGIVCDMPSLPIDPQVMLKYASRRNVHHIIILKSSLVAGEMIVKDMQNQAGQNERTITLEAFLTELKK